MILPLTCPRRSRGFLAEIRSREEGRGGYIIQSNRDARNIRSLLLSHFRPAVVAILGLDQTRKLRFSPPFSRTFRRSHAVYSLEKCMYQFSKIGRKKLATGILVSQGRIPTGVGSNTWRATRLNASLKNSKPRIRIAEREHEEN